MRYLGQRTHQRRYCAAGTGLRTEHLKSFFESLEAEFVVLFEAIERFAIPA